MMACAACRDIGGGERRCPGAELAAFWKAGRHSADLGAPGASVTSRRWTTSGHQQSGVHEVLDFFRPCLDQGKLAIETQVCRCEEVEAGTIRRFSATVRT